MDDAQRRPRIAFFSYSNALFDSRTARLARSAASIGFDAVIYARWEPGLPLVDERDGISVRRVPLDWRLAFPLTRSWGRRRVARLTATARGGPKPQSGVAPVAPDGDAHEGGVRRRLASLPGASLVAGTARQLLLFPLRPMGWAAALDEVVEPADVWHGMWAGSLPALDRFRRRFGGRSIYDSRDIYLHARSFDRIPRPIRGGFRLLERRWARRADAVVTVNDAYAQILRQTLGTSIAAVVRNCPPRRDAPRVRPDRIRAALSMPDSVSIVLYQGNLMTERGIEESMDAILAVPGAALVLLGYGALRAELRRLAAQEPYAGHVFVLDAVPPSELLDWTASADILVMAIQPTTLNHRYTTPNKLWEGLAAGVPVVASDLPGMADVVRETGAGILCDPTSPASIAAGIRGLLELPEHEREAMRVRALGAAHDRYNWETQVAPLLEIYRGFLPDRLAVTPPPSGRSMDPGDRAADASRSRSPRANAAERESGS